MRTIIPRDPRSVPTPRTASRSLLLALLLTASLLVAAAPAATATTSFQFKGSGWGHGVGMSQYGALELARDGRSAEQIIAHYYTGARAEKRNDLDVLSAPINVGLSQNLTSVTIRTNGTPASIDFGESTSAPRDVPSNGTARLQELSDGRCRLQINDTTVAHASNCWANLSRSSGGYFTISNETVRYGRGHLELRPNGNKFHVSAVLPNIDEYLLGLREMPAYWGTQEWKGMEALQAQAITGRSYAAYDLLGSGMSTTCHCHLYDSVKSQVYGGTTGETDTWRRAVTDTAGQVVWAEGAPGTEGGGVVQAFYSSSSGGRSEAIEDSSAFRSEPRTYFSSVDDPWSLRASNPYGYWTIDVPESTIRRNLSLDDVLSIAVTARNESGSAREVTFTGTRDGRTATVTTTGDKLRGLLGLRSGYIASVFLPPFVDDDGNTHEADIAWLAGEEITKGCNPPSNTKYCPNDAVTRAEMATFLTRALNLRPQSEPFDDVASTDTHAGSIGAIAARGITKGCNPPSNTQYCPNDPVTRAQMASFIRRAGL